MSSEKRTNVSPVFAGVALGVLLCPLMLFAVFKVTHSKSSDTFPRSVVKHEESGEGGVAEFTLKLAGLDAGDWDMVAMSTDMVNIAKHEVTENHTEGSILFEVVGDGEDEYGHTIQVDAFRLVYSMDDLKQIEWSNFDGEKLLNLGKIVDESRAGQKVIVGYCDKHREWSASFCEVGTTQWH